MRLVSAALFAQLVACTLSLPVPRQDREVPHADPQVPVPLAEITDVRKLSPQSKEAVVKQLQTDMVRAAQVGVAAQAVRLEQKFEDEILTTAVKKLAAHRGDKAKQAEDLRQLRELVRRDKRAVEVLSNVLGSSSGSSSGTGSGNDDSNDGGSNILSLVSSLLGSSSGGGDGDGEGGGGSNILSLLGPLSGSLSGGSGGGGGGDGEDGGGGSDLLSLLTGLLGSSSGSSTGGGDSQDGGGGSNVLSLLSTLLGSSSGTGDGNGGAGSAGGSKDPLKGGTYDDLIGKGPFSSFSNTFSRLLMFKFTIFRTAFSLITSILSSKSSTS